MARSKDKVDPMDALRADIKADQFKPVYHLLGQDSHRVSQAYDLLFAAALGSGPRGFNDQIFEGEKASGDAIAGAAAHLPMMASRRVVVVRKSEKLSKDDRDRLGDYCGNPSPTTVLILLATAGARKGIDGRSRLAKAIKKNGRWCLFSKLYGRQLHAWIHSEAASLGKRLPPDAAPFLEALMGNDLAQLANGLRHAALFVGEAEDIDRESLEEVVSGRKQEALWHMLDAVGERRLGPALRNLQLLHSQGEDAHAALSLVRSRMRVLLATERGIAGGMGQQQALRDAGVAPNMTWKYRDQVGRYRLGELQRALSRLVRAESDQKGGKRIEPMWSLEQAIRDVIDG